MGKRNIHHGTETDLSFLFSDFFETFSPDWESLFQEGKAAEENAEVFADYLQKGERLVSLAREKFKRVYQKISLTDADQKIFSSLPEDSESLSDMVCRISRVFTRPLLKAMKAADDACARTLVESIRTKTTHIEILWGGDPMNEGFIYRHFKSKTDPRPQCLTILLQEEGYPVKVICGIKEHSHPSSLRGKILQNSACIEDLNVFLSYMILYRYLSTTLDGIREGEDSVSDNVKHLFIEKIEAFERNFMVKNITAAPKEACKLLKKCTLPELLTYPFHMGKLERQELQSFVCEQLEIQHTPVIVHPNRRDCVNAMDQLTDTEQPQFRINSGHGEMFFCYLLRYHLPYHYLLKGFTVSGVKYLHAIPHSLKSKDRYYWEPDGLILLADLFRIIARDKSNQKQLVTYYRDLEKSYAKSFMLKKDIPQKTKHAMEASLFNRYFGFVEFDEETDLKKVEEIAKEFQAVKESFLQNVVSAGNAIRFRKLGQHKALGLYYPTVSCLCVDIRSPSSLIHEYGHLIDYTYDRLSEKFAFEPLRRKYVEQLEEVLKKDDNMKQRLAGGGKYNKSYYTMPTEIFARCFELYVSQCLKVKNSIVPANFSSPGIYPTDAKFLEEVEAYFSSLQLGNVLKQTKPSFETEVAASAQ